MFSKSQSAQAALQRMAQQRLIEQQREAERRRQEDRRRELERKRQEDQRRREAERKQREEELRRREVERRRREEEQRRQAAERRREAEQRRQRQVEINRAAVNNRFVRANASVSAATRLKTSNQHKQHELKIINEKNEINKNKFNQTNLQNRKRKAEQLQANAFFSKKTSNEKEELVKDANKKKARRKIPSQPPTTHISKKAKTTELQKQEDLRKAEFLNKLRSIPPTQTPISPADLFLSKLRSEQPLSSTLPLFDSRLSQQRSGWESAPAPQHFNSNDDAGENGKVLGNHSQPKIHYKERPKRQNAPNISKQEKEERAEQYAVDHFVKNGYRLVATKIRSRNGIDNFFVKCNGLNQIESVVIVESKFSSSGRLKLDKSKKGVQMTHQWLKETLILMESSSCSEVRAAAKAIKENGNHVLDNRFANVMTPDGKVKWFRFIKKKYDTRNFYEDPDDFSDGELYETDEQNVVPREFTYSASKTSRLNIG